MTASVGIKYVEHICTVVSPWSVLLRRNAFFLRKIAWLICFLTPVSFGPTPTHL